MSDPVDHLKHYGIKGMRWGTRRKRGSDGRVSVDHRTTQQLKERPTSQLTNMQLKKANERMNLEQNFKRLNPAAKRKGAVVVAGLLTAAKVGATTYNQVKSPAGQAAISAGKKAMAASKAAKAARPDKLLTQVAKGNFG